MFGARAYDNDLSSELFLCQNFRSFLIIIDGLLAQSNFKADKGQMVEWIPQCLFTMNMCKIFDFIHASRMILGDN